jgi:hypothetical protein
MSKAIGTMAKTGARIAKVRLPPELAAAIDAFATRARSQHESINVSVVLRLLLRSGLAADAQRRIDLRDAGYREGWMAGHAEAVEAHQRALYDARSRLRQQTA